MKSWLLDSVARKVSLSARRNAGHALPWRYLNREEHKADLAMSSLQPIDYGFYAVSAIV